MLILIDLFAAFIGLIS